MFTWEIIIFYIKGSNNIKQSVDWEVDYNCVLIFILHVCCIDPLFSLKNYEDLTTFAYLRLNCSACGTWSHAGLTNEYLTASILFVESIPQYTFRVALSLDLIWEVFHIASLHVQLARTRIGHLRYHIILRRKNIAQFQMSSTEICDQGLMIVLVRILRKKCYPRFSLILLHSFR